VPYARYKFPADVSNPADQASILIGTTEFDAAWPAGAPDFTFTAPVTRSALRGARLPTAPTACPRPSARGASRPSTRWRTAPATRARSTSARSSHLTCRQTLRPVCTLLGLGLFVTPARLRIPAVHHATTR
jgi:hypothetical protein